MAVYRDVTAITNLRTCTFINSPMTIKSIGTGVLTRPVDTYTLIGNKYELTNTQVAGTETIPGGAVCLNSTTILVLESDLPIINTTNTTVDFTSVNNTIKDVVVPFYHEMAILSALLIFYGAYRLILYPFFRKR